MFFSPPLSFLGEESQFSPFHPPSANWRRRKGGEQSESRNPGSPCLFIRMKITRMKQKKKGGGEKHKDTIFSCPHFPIFAILYSIQISQVFCYILVILENESKLSLSPSRRRESMNHRLVIQ